MKPLVRLRVYCDPKKRKTSPYFTVSVWRTITDARKRMMELATTTDCRRRAANAAGACFAWDHLSVSRCLMPDMGEIVLCDRYSGSGTISHECTHAAVAYMNRLKDYGKSIRPTEEERLCLTVGFLTRQICLRLYTRQQKLLKAK